MTRRRSWVRFSNDTHCFDTLDHGPCIKQGGMSYTLYQASLYLSSSLPDIIMALLILEFGSHQIREEYMHDQNTIKVPFIERFFIAAGR